VQDLELLVKHLHEMNRDYDLRYPTGYQLILPSASEGLSIASALRGAIAPTVGAAHMKAETRFASDMRDHRGAKIQWSN